MVFTTKTSKCAALNPSGLEACLTHTESGGCSCVFSVHASASDRDLCTPWTTSRLQTMTPDDQLCSTPSILRIHVRPPKHNIQVLMLHSYFMFVICSQDLPRARAFRQPWGSKDLEKIHGERLLFYFVVVKSFYVIGRLNTMIQYVEPLAEQTSSAVSGGY